MKTRRIAVFSTADDTTRKQYNQTFVSELNTRLQSDDIVVEWFHYHDVRIDFAPGSVDVRILRTGEQLAAYDFILFKSYKRYAEQATTIAAYLDETNVPYVCSELRSYLPTSKLTEAVRLARHNLPIAQTLYMAKKAFLLHYDEVVETLGVPFIFKTIDGKGGSDNYLIHDRAELEECLQHAQSEEWIAQRFIENEYDLRILVVGKEIRLVIERRRGEGTHLNNTSQGAQATLLEPAALPEKEAQLALEAAAVMGREIAGVDLMYETGTGRPIILEVNASPQVATGAFTDEKLGVYCEYFKNVLK